MNTVVGYDDSATDKLIVNGNTTGDTVIAIQNRNGKGAMTDVGIKVVDVAGNSNGNFTLEGGKLLVGDGVSQHQFIYTLHKGDDGPANYHYDLSGLSAADLKDWYLRSTCGSGSHIATGTDVDSSTGLGCASDDKITLTLDSSVSIATVEGAGGADKILINGDTKVTGSVFGGNNGLDNSKDSDGADEITIAGNAQIGGDVDGQADDDKITVEGDAKVAGKLIGGEGNDTITVQGNAKVTGILDGGNGNDTFVWSGASTIGGVEGGAGSDKLTVSSTGYDGSQTLDGGDDVSAADKQIDTLTFSGVTATTAGNTLTNWEQIQLADDTTLTLTGKLVTGAGKDDSGNPLGLDINNDSTLQIAGTDPVEIKGDVKNSGLIDLTAPDNNPVQKFKITGNYTGDNGAIKMNVSLDGDSSTKDGFTIDGNTSGTTKVTVVKTGDTGKLPSDIGIKLIEVTGNSDGDFTLANELKSTLDSGQKFVYDLYKGKTGPNGNIETVTDEKSWYLRAECEDGSHTATGTSVSTTTGLGCKTDDTITLTLDAGASAVVKVEGAGGADMIVINGDTKVTGSVFGGNDGLDKSGAKDGGDTITIAGNAQVGGDVDGQAGDDTITVQGNAQVTGKLIGGAGDDTIVWSGASTIGGVEGGDGSDKLTVSSTGYDGNQTLDGGDDVKVDDGYIDTLIFSGITAETSGDKLINWEKIILDPSTTLTLSGALTTGAGTDGSGAKMGLLVSPDAVLVAKGALTTITGDVTNEGTIDLASDTFDVAQELKISGNYHGEAGSELLMNLEWNAPGDESGGNSAGDKLTIAGAATGNTEVVLVNGVGERGAIQGSVQQIQKIINSVPTITVGTPDSDADNMVFTGAAQTVSGVEAQLAKRTGSSGDEYYWTIGAADFIYEPTVPGYVMMPMVNKEQGYASLRTLHERRGDNQPFAWDREKNYEHQTWGRLYGDHTDLGGRTRFGADMKLTGFQFGHDIAVKPTNQGGYSLTGVFGGYSHASTTFSDKFRSEAGVLTADKKTGSGKSDAWHIGVSHTRYSTAGAYLDLVGQLTYYRNTYSAKGAEKVRQNGTGVILSAEAGYPFVLKGTATEGWQLEPQAQLVYQGLKLKSVNDGTREVKQGTHHDLRGRLGARLTYTTTTESGRKGTVYAVANVWHDFAKPKAVMMGSSGHLIRETPAKTWAEVGVGAQLPIGKQAHLYGDVRYEKELGAGKRHGYRGTVGFKYSW